MKTTNTACFIFSLKFSVGKIQSIKHENPDPPGERAVKRVKSPDDERTLVYVVRGIAGRVFTVTMDAIAPIHELKKRIYEENAPQLPNVTATTMDVYSTQNFPGGWTKLNPRGFLVDIEIPQVVAPLLPTKRIGHYFPSDIPDFDSDVVHVVAETSSITISQTHTRPPVEVLRDEVPIPNETREQGLHRVGRLQDALGLCIVWEMASHRDHINFSKEHDYQGAQWLEYDHHGHSRVFIGDKTTWKELFIAADKALLEAEGRARSRFIEDFTWLQDGITLHVQIGT